jgi:transcriptional regulator with XRE-family HTH domain
MLYTLENKKIGGITMLYLSENLRRYRLQKDLTQEEIANFLNITPQSVSKWERGESYPDISLLPAIANILERSIDELLGMDVIRSEQARLEIHKKASDFQRAGDFSNAEKVYRDALLIYPNKPGMMLGLAGVLALQNNTEQAAELMEKGIKLSENEKQKATCRAVLCFLYLNNGDIKKATELAARLPHTRESREVISPIIASLPDEKTIQSHIKLLLLGE